MPRVKATFGFLLGPSAITPWLQHLTTPHLTTHHYITDIGPPYLFILISVIIDVSALWKKQLGPVVFALCVCVCVCVCVCKV